MTVNNERNLSDDALAGIDVRAKAPLDPFGIRPSKYCIYLVDSEAEEEVRLLLNEGQMRTLAARITEMLR